MPRHRTSQGERSYHQGKGFRGMAWEKRNTVRSAHCRQPDGGEGLMGVWSVEWGRGGCLWFGSSFLAQCPCPTIQQLYLSISTARMSHQVPLPSLSEAEFINQDLLINVRQWLNDNDRRWEEVDPSLPEHWPQCVALDAIARPKILVCRSEGLQEQKEKLWENLYPIALQRFQFVRITTGVLAFFADYLTYT